MVLLVLGLGAVIFGVGWLVTCLTSPFVRCRCEARRRCRRCKGSGYRKVAGAQAINRFVNDLRRSL